MRALKKKREKKKEKEKKRNSRSNAETIRTKRYMIGAKDKNEE